MPEETLYKKLGLTAESVPSLRSLGPRHFTVKTVEQPGGDPIVGLTYRTDYRHEEETGVGRLVERLTGPDPRNRKITTEAACGSVAVFTNVTALALSAARYSIEDLENLQPAWGEPLQRGENAYGKHFAESVGYAQGTADLYWELWHLKVPEVRERAKAAGVKPLPRGKGDLIRAICAKSPADHPNRWPGWFNNGTALVLRADRKEHGTDAENLTHSVLEHLIEAAQDERLGVVAHMGPFSSGLFLYDTRDESSEFQIAMTQMWDYYEAKMADVKDLPEELDAEGHRIFYLDTPREVDGETQYYINSTAGSGWFTYSQLKDRSFIEIAKAEAEEREKKRQTA